VIIIGRGAGEGTLVCHMAPSAKADSDLARADYTAREKDNCGLILNDSPTTD